MIERQTPTSNNSLFLGIICPSIQSYPTEIMCAASHKLIKHGYGCIQRLEGHSHHSSSWHHDPAQGWDFESAELSYKLADQSNLLEKKQCYSVFLMKQYTKLKRYHFNNRYQFLYSVQVLYYEGNFITMLN